MDGVVVADQLIRPGRIEHGERAQPWATKEELEAVLKLRGRANGVRTARQALALARPGADSPAETWLRVHMHQAGLPEPEVNVWLRSDSGERVVQPDLSISQYRIAIQYDGEDYHSGAQMRKDVRRTELTEALGWVEVRITKDHMRNGGRAAVTKIAAVLRKHWWSG